MKHLYFSAFIGRIVILSIFLLPSCAALAQTRNGKAGENAMVANRSTPEQPQKSLALPSSLSKTETVKTRLTQLFDLCRSGDAETAAAYFVYRGTDKSRRWKDTYRASDPAEKAEVRDACLRIKGYLDESQGYSFGAVIVEKEPEGEWHALEVSFQQGDKRKKVIFAFLLIKGQFAIGDIDG